MSTTPRTKLAILTELMAEGRWPEALSLANTFAYLGRHKRDIQRAHAAHGPEAQLRPQTPVYRPIDPSNSAWVWAPPQGFAVPDWAAESAAAAEKVPAPAWSEPARLGEMPRPQQPRTPSEMAFLRMRIKNAADAAVVRAVSRAADVITSQELGDEDDYSPQRPEPEALQFYHSEEVAAATDKAAAAAEKAAAAAAVEEATRQIKQAEHERLMKLVSAMNAKEREREQQSR